MPHQPVGGPVDQREKAPGPRGLRRGLLRYAIAINHPTRHRWVRAWVRADFVVHVAVESFITLGWCAPTKLDSDTLTKRLGAHWTGGAFSPGRVCH